MLTRATQCGKHGDTRHRTIGRHRAIGSKVRPGWTEGGCDPARRKLRVADAMLPQFHVAECQVPSKLR